MADRKGSYGNKLTDAEMKQLAELGKQIQLNLSCDVNGSGLPCHTDRLAAVQLMRRYLDIHEFISVTSSDFDKLLTRAENAS